MILPNGLLVGGNIILNHTAITSLPDKITFGGYIDINNTGITELSENSFFWKYIYLDDLNEEPVLKPTKILSSEETNKLDNLRIALHTCKVKLINTLKLVKW